MKMPHLHNRLHMLLPTLLLLVTCTFHAQNDGLDQSSVNARASRLGQSFGSYLATATVTADDDALASAYASLLSEVEEPYRSTVTGRDLGFSTLISQATGPAELSSLHERASRLRTRLGHEEARETGTSDAGSASDAVADTYTGASNSTANGTESGGGGGGDNGNGGKIGGGVGGALGALVLIGAGVGIWWWMARRKRAKGKEQRMANNNEGWTGDGPSDGGGAVSGKPELEARPVGPAVAVGEKPELEGTGRVEIGENEGHGPEGRIELPAPVYDTRTRWELDANETARRPELDSGQR